MPRPEWLAPRVAVGIVAFLCVVMFLFRSGAAPLSSPNEGLYAQIAREMLERRDWIVPRINSVLYFEKPPLLYWLVATSLRLFGETSFAARLPSGLAGVLTTWLVFLLGARLFGRTAGALSAIVAATSLGFVLMTREVMFDALLTALMTLSLVSFWMTATGKGRAWVLVMYTALGLAVLTKGLLGILFPALIILTYAAVARDWRSLRPVISVGGVMLFLAIAVPWHVAVAKRHHEFVWFYFINEHLLRFLGRRQPADYFVGEVYTPSLASLLLFFPWSGLLPGTLCRVLSSQRRQGHWGRETVFVLCWVLAPILFFTLSRTRTIYYMLPVVPPLALVIGNAWREAPVWWKDRRWRRWTDLSLLVTFGVTSGAWLWCGAHASGDTLRAEQFGIAFVSSSCLVAGLAAAVVLSRLGKPFISLSCIAASVAATWLVVLLSVRASMIPSEKSMADTIVRSQPRGSAIVAMEGRLEDHSSFVFYLPRQLRPVRMVEGRWGGDLEFGSRFPSARPLFLSPDQLRNLSGHRPLYYLTHNPPHYPIPPSMQLLHRDNETLLWANSSVSEEARAELSSMYSR